MEPAVEIGHKITFFWGPHGKRFLRRAGSATELRNAAYKSLVARATINDGAKWSENAILSLRRRSSKSHKAAAGRDLEYAPQIGPYPIWLKFRPSRGLGAD